MRKVLDSDPRVEGTEHVLWKSSEGLGVARAGIALMPLATSDFGRYTWLAGVVAESGECRTGKEV